MVTSGNLFIERDAPRPKFFQAQDDAHHTGWLPVRHNLAPHELDSELSKLGWTFFFMANVIRKSALAFDGDKGLSTALKRVMATVREEGCNCLQVDKVETQSFLGVPYITLSAHPRHLQKSGVFSPYLQPNAVETGPLELRARKSVV